MWLQGDENLADAGQGVHREDTQGRWTVDQAIIRCATALEFIDFPTQDRLTSDFSGQFLLEPGQVNVAGNDPQ